MALPELAVMQQTFELLHPLDPSARRRVLRWVRAALQEDDPGLAPVDAEAEAADEPALSAETVADSAPAPAAVAEVPAESPAEAPAEPPAESPAETPAEPPAPAAGRRGRRAARTAAKSTRRRAAAKATEAEDTGRRGRPPAEDIMRVYEQADGKLTEVAKHYGKPYGTVQGWASALRKQGYPIGRSRTS